MSSHNRTVHGDRWARVSGAHEGLLRHLLAGYSTARDCSIGGSGLARQADNRPVPAGVVELATGHPCPGDSMSAVRAYERGFGYGSAENSRRLCSVHDAPFLHQRAGGSRTDRGLTTNDRLQPRGRRETRLLAPSEYTPSGRYRHFSTGLVPAAAHDPPAGGGRPPHGGSVGPVRRAPRCGAGRPRRGSSQEGSRRSRSAHLLPQPPDRCRKERRAPVPARLW